MITIKEIKTQEKSIVGTYIDSKESREMLKIVVDSICSNEFGTTNTKYVETWIKLNISKDDNGLVKEFIFTSKQ